MDKQQSNAMDMPSSRRGSMEADSRRGSLDSRSSLDSAGSFGASFDKEAGLFMKQQRAKKVWQAPEPAYTSWYSA